MQISIPENAASILRSKAERSGCESVSDYVMRLVILDEPDELKLAFGDPRIEEAIDEGYASGNSGPMTEERWAALEQRVDERTEERSALRRHRAGEV